MSSKQTITDLEFLVKHFPKICGIKADKDGWASFRKKSNWRVPQAAYIKLNPPKEVHWLVVDCDVPGAACAWDFAKLPMPTFIATNPENGHAHIAWAIERPVLCYDTSSHKPIDLLKLIHAHFTEALRGDRSFNLQSAFVKNPLSKRWIVEAHQAVYSLDDLAECLPEHTRPKRRTQVVPDEVSRNITIFNNLRKWGYSAYRAYGNLSDKQPFLNACTDQALALRTTISDPGGPFHHKGYLPIKETEHIAKSVARWITDHFSKQGLSDNQRARACSPTTQLIYAAYFAARKARMPATMRKHMGKYRHVPELVEKLPKITVAFNVGLHTTNGDQTLARLAYERIRSELGIDARALTRALTNLGIRIEAIPKASKPWLTRNISRSAWYARGLHRTHARLGSILRQAIYRSRELATIRWVHLDKALHNLSSLDCAEPELNAPINAEVVARQSGPP